MLTSFRRLWKFFKKCLTYYSSFTSNNLCCLLVQLAPLQTPSTGHHSPETLAKGIWKSHRRSKRLFLVQGAPIEMEYWASPEWQVKVAKSHTPMNTQQCSVHLSALQCKKKKSISIELYRFSLILPSFPLISVSLGYKTALVTASSWSNVGVTLLEVSM